jgi:Mlc titration factor MtfA (ptsG expression regulator)
VRLFRRREVVESAALSALVGAVSALALATVSRRGLGAILLAATVCGAGAFLWLARRWLRRAWLLSRPIDPAVRDVLSKHVEYYRRSSAAQRLEFERNVRCFLDEHTIKGPQQREVSLETRVLVAASAAILLFGREDLDFPSRIDVVVYPDAFTEDYEVAPRGALLGQARPQGPVILSERALREGFARASDGIHVGIHEFAHMLDLEGARFDGTPSGMDSQSARSWAALVHREMARIERHRSILRAYGAVNEAEFFAVASEAFFERPRAMKARHPALYRALSEFYGQDPASDRARGAEAKASSTEG